MGEKCLFFRHSVKVSAIYERVIQGNVAASIFNQSMKNSLSAL